MKKNLIAIALGVAVGVLIGLNETRSHGYLVPYTAVLVLFTAGVVIVAGFVLLFFRTTRRVGFLSLVSAVVLVAAFYTTIIIANRLGAWDEPMIRLGPGVKASWVILFNEEATDQQILEFVTTVLSTPDPRGGHAHRPGLGSLLKVRVGNYDGYALQFERDATFDQIAKLRSLVNGSPIVWRIYEDIAPDDIKLSAGRPFMGCGGQE